MDDNCYFGCEQCDECWRRRECEEEDKFSQLEDEYRDRYYHDNE